MSIQKPINENYAAIVTEIKVILPLENCDNLVHLNCFGNMVISDKSVKIGDVGIYFPLESKLSESFLKSNNLYSKPELNSDQTKKGYFKENGRIRAVKLRGHKSMGIFMPLSSLDFTNHKETLKLNDTFDMINDIKICEKFVPKFIQRVRTEGTGKKGKKVAKFNKLIDNQFSFHIDTSQLGKNIWKIKKQDIRK